MIDYNLLFYGSMFISFSSIVTVIIWYVSNREIKK